MAEIIWTAPEFEYREKDISWYWMSIIVAVLIIGVAVWQRNFLFGFFVVIAEILLLVWGNRKPLLIDFTLTEKGLTIGGRKFYAVGEIESFSFDDSGDEWADIVLLFRRHFRPTLTVHIPKARAGEVQRTLKLLVGQIEREESFIDVLQKFLRF